MIITEYFPDVFRMFGINAETAKADLTSVSEKKLSVEEAEKRYGIFLGSSRDRIVEMRQLFELDVAAAPGQKTLQDHVSVVR